MDPRLSGLRLKTSLPAVADLVMPRECVVCGRILIPQERHICTECLADLPETHFAALSRNPMADAFNERIISDVYEPYAYAAALYYYSAEAGYKRISQALKYGRDFGAGKHFARMLGERLSLSPLYKDVDLVVPVPLHWSRRWTRGYNQAEVIAKEIGKRLGAPCEGDLLKRNRRTRTQTRLSGEAKSRNVAGAFSVRKPSAVRGASHILLVDDVFTTGATLSECQKALRRICGPSVRISAATLGFVKRS